MQNIKFMRMNFTALDTLLTTSRTQGDEIVDQFLFHQIDSLGHRIFEKLNQIDDFENQNPLEPFLVDFITKNKSLPDWADSKKILKGQAFFQKNVADILFLLGFMSLPYCYAAADGARVLAYSKRIQEDTERRLLETAKFVLAVGTEDINTNLPYSVLKVRLVHSAVRYHILEGGHWQMNWGYPVNQEDMSGTNLAFSYIVLRGLRKIGISYTQSEAEAFLHLWATVGYWMGVQEELIPQQLKEAYYLDKAICKRHFKESPQGTSLTNALIESLKEQGKRRNIPQKTVNNYMRFLLGESVADILNIDPYDQGQILVTANKWKNIVWEIFVVDNRSEKVLKQLGKELKMQKIHISIPEFI